jgi:hypothetical protein
VAAGGGGLLWPATAMPATIARSTETTLTSR